MKKYLLPIAILFGTHHAQGAVINFDDIPLNVSGVLNVPDNYGGFVWPTNGNPLFFAIGNGPYQGIGNYGNSYGAPSGQIAVSNYGSPGVAVSRSDGGTFSFSGAYFSTWTSYDQLQSTSATMLTINGYNGSTLVGSTNVAFTAGGYKWVSANFEKITSVAFSGSNSIVAPYQTSWLMDDFTYEAGSTQNTVPLPASSLLIGLGLAAVAASRRKTKLQRPE
jgi:hypothetical protein